MTTIVFAHGHTGSASAFNYIKASGAVDGATHWYDLAYDSDDGFNFNLAYMRKELEDVRGDLFFVAHSMGGKYAAYLANEFRDRTVGGVTLATPFLGSEVATSLSMFLPDQVYKDISPYSPVITKAQDFTLPGYWVAVVTTKGQSNFIQGKNDGVVSDASMRGRTDVGYVEIASTHNEVLLSNHAVGIIKMVLESSVGVKV